jgi:hypothetical protein
VRRRAEERTDALVEAFARVLETINALEPPPRTEELWQRALGRVIGERGFTPAFGDFWGRIRGEYDVRVRKGYELALSELDESLLRIVLAAHDPRLRSQLQKQDRILIQDGTEDWLASLDWHDVRERGHEKMDPDPFSIADPWAEPPKSLPRLKQVTLETAKAELEGVRTRKCRGWWRRPCRKHKIKIKGCSQCIRKRGRPKKQGASDATERFNQLAHAAGYGPDVFKRPAKAGRPSRSEIQRLDLVASAVLVLYDEGHSLETIGAVIGGGRQRAHELLHRAKKRAA